MNVTIVSIDHYLQLLDAETDSGARGPLWPTSGAAIATFLGNVSLKPPFRLQSARS